MSLNEQPSITVMSTNEQTTFTTSVDAQRAEDTAQQSVFVWYASYGSNLLEERFNRYLRGGRVNGMSQNCVGARDPTPASEWVIKSMPYPVFFAYAMLSSWGFGGVAMLDVTPTPETKTLMRLYKVTLQQFNDIVAQENDLHPPLPTTNLLTCELLSDLRQRSPGSLQPQFESGLYPAVAYLGEHDDVPILTFTCLTESAEEIMMGKTPSAPPAENYLVVLRKGIQEVGLNEADAKIYWQEKIAKQFVN